MFSIHRVGVAIRNVAAIHDGSQVVVAFIGKDLLVERAIRLACHHSDLVWRATVVVFGKCCVDNVLRNGGVANTLDIGCGRLGNITFVVDIITLLIGTFPFVPYALRDQGMKAYSCIGSKAN